MILIIIISLIQFFKRNIKYQFYGLILRKTVLQGVRGALDLNSNPNSSNIIIIILLPIIFSAFYYCRHFYPSISIYIKRLQFNLPLRSTSYIQQKFANNLVIHRTVITIYRFLLASHYSHSQTSLSAFCLHQTTNQ